METNLNSGGKIREGKSNLLFGDRSLTICFHQPPLSSCLNCQSAMEEKALCACLQKVTVITIMNGILHRACKDQQLLHPSCLCFVPVSPRAAPSWGSAQSTSASPSSALYSSSFFLLIFPNLQGETAFPSLPEGWDQDLCLCFWLGALTQAEVLLLLPVAAPSPRSSCWDGRDDGGRSDHGCIWGGPRDGKEWVCKGWWHSERSQGHKSWMIPKVMRRSLKVCFQNLSFFPGLRGE